MAKRFTDTGIWDKNWFLEAPDKYKLLWFWLKDKCNEAGLLDFSCRIASTYVGKEVTEADLDFYGSRVVKLKPGKYFIRSFVTFQYGKELKSESRVHKKVIDLLSDAGIDPKSLNRVSATLSDRVSNALEEKDKEQEKEKDKEQDKEKDRPVLDFQNPKIQITPDQVVQFWNDTIGKKLSKFCKGLGADKRRENTITMLGYLPTQKHWAEYFDEISKSKFITQEMRAFNFDWVVKHDNYLNVMEGKYADKEKAEESFEEWQARVRKEMA